MEAGAVGVVVCVGLVIWVGVPMVGGWGGGLRVAVRGGDFVVGGRGGGLRLVGGMVNVWLEVSGSLNLTLGVALGFLDPYCGTSMNPSSGSVISMVDGSGEAGGGGAIRIDHFGVGVIGVEGGFWLVGDPICGVVVILFGHVTVVEVTGSPVVSSRISV